MDQFGAPRSSQKLPRSCSEAPGSSQEAPRKLPGSSQEAPRSSQKLPEAGQKLPGPAQELPRAHFCSKYIDFSINFNSTFCYFCDAFRVLQNLQKRRKTICFLCFLKVRVFSSRSPWGWLFEVLELLFGSLGLVLVAPWAPSVAKMAPS